MGIFIGLSIAFLICWMIMAWSMTEDVLMEEKNWFLSYRKLFLLQIPISFLRTAIIAITILMAKAIFDI